MSVRATLSKDPFIDIATRFLEILFADFRHSDFVVRLWDGSVWGDSRRPRFTLVLTSPSALRRVFSASTELALGEAFINGDLDVEGDLEHAFHLGDFLLESSHHLVDKLQLGSLFAKLPASSSSVCQHNDAELDGALHSKKRDSRAVTYHYDLSNAFYSLWLDPLMVYSCAYFKSRHVGLEGAQKQKLDYICKKLRLRKGDRILDLGCGWGGLMLYAAQHYGVHAFGITLSVPQAEFARERFRAAGVADRCKVEVVITET